MDFPGGSDGKASAYNKGDPGSIPGLGRSPGEGNGNSLHYSCLENSTDGGAWWATVHGVTNSRTQLSDFTFTFPSPMSQFTLPISSESIFSMKSFSLKEKKVSAQLQVCIYCFFSYKLSRFFPPSCGSSLPIALKCFVSAV